MTAKQGVITLAAIVAAIHATAIEGLQIRVQCPDVVLSWPSQAGEKYIVQYRPTLSTNTPWLSLTNSLPSAVNTNWTSFMHSNITTCPPAGGGGAGGGGGSPHSPNSAQSSSGSLSTMTAEQRDARRQERLRQAEALIEELMNLLRKAEADARSDRERRLREGSNSSQAEMGAAQFAAAQGGDEAGFYRVVRTGVHFFNLTNGTLLSGTVQLPIETGHHEGTLEVVTLSANNSGIPIEGAAPLSTPFPTPALRFELNTRYLPNGSQTLRASANLRITQTNMTDSPFIGLVSQPVTVTISNAIFYPTWEPLFADNLMYMFVSSAFQNVDWELDVFGESFDFIGTFGGHTADGSIAIAWDLRDPQGIRRTDAMF